MPVVFSCITNQKDNLIPVNSEPGVRFVCFSDRSFRHPVWEYMPVHTLGLGDPRRVARRYKILSHLYFPGEITIWVDGRVKLLKPVSHYIQKYKGLISARLHHDRSCVYSEANQIKRIDYDDHGIVNRHVKFLRELGYPEGNGLHETGMILRRPGKKTNAFNEKWWSLLSAGSKRDQLSFDVAAHLLKINISAVDRNEVQVLNHRLRTNAIS